MNFLKVGEPYEAESFSAEQQGRTSDASGVKEEQDPVIGGENFLTAEDCMAFGRQVEQAVKVKATARRQYLLLYLCDKTYEVLASDSALLPLRFDCGRAKAKDVIPVKPDLVGVVVAKSEFETDMLIYKRRLEKQVTKKSAISVRDSSNLFNQSAVMQSIGRMETEENDEEDDDSVSDASVSEEFHVLLREQNESFEQMINIQKRILEEVKLLRKTTVKEDRRVPPTLSTDVEAVMYCDENLTTMGDSDMRPSAFGQQIARYLFSDEELGSCMLFPRRETGRKPLSPRRSQVFKRAVLARYNSDRAVLRSAVSAVNQLGIDLRRGRRKRK